MVVLEEVITNGITEFIREIFYESAEKNEFALDDLLSSYLNKENLVKIKKSI